MSEDPLIGTLLGNFRIERLLGRGGMARVYYGHDVNLQRPVAIKMIDAQFRDDTGYAKRFISEARAIATWRHENVIQVFHAGSQKGLYYFVMEYIDGMDLSTLLSQYSAENELMPHDDVLKIGHAVANALDYAHERGVVHRDIKPANVMVSHDGRVVLTDFGLALDVQKGSMGQIFGTPHYIAPEQARRSSDAVAQSDLYSLGVLLFEMLTGMVPFDDDSATSVALKHLSDPPPRPGIINPRLNAATEEVLLKALEKNIGDRYPTGKDLMDALDKAITTTETVEPTTAPKHDLPPMPPGIKTQPRRTVSGVSVFEKVALDHEAKEAKPAAKPTPSSAGRRRSRSRRTTDHPTRQPVKQRDLPDFLEQLGLGALKQLPTWAIAVIASVATALVLLLAVLVITSLSGGGGDEDVLPTRIAMETATATDVDVVVVEETEDPTATDEPTTDVPPTTTTVPDTATPVPTDTDMPPTDTPVPPSATPVPSDTPVPPTATDEPTVESAVVESTDEVTAEGTEEVVVESPTATDVPPTATPVPDTDTPAPTDIPATDTRVPPTSMPLRPTITPRSPSDTPQPPSDTPVPPTATDEPPTEEPSDTPVPDTATPEATEEPVTDTPAPPTDTPTPETPEPTVVYPDGRLIQLFYDEHSFYLYNPNLGVVETGLFAFESLHQSGASLGYSFNGQVWADDSNIVGRSRCLFIETEDSDAGDRPRQCRGYNAEVSVELSDRQVFWTERSRAAMFRVLWDNAEVARCEIEAGFCEVFVPGS